MSMGHTRPSEARSAELKILPDGRKRLTRYRTLSQATKLNDDLVQTYGTQDTAPATSAEKTAGFTNLRLVDQYSAEPGSIAGIDLKTPLWVEVYETIPATGELQVGQNTRITLEDGREAIEATFLQWATDTYVPGTVGTTTAPGDASAFLKQSRQTNDGALRRITREYVYAGIIEQDDQSLNGGALLKRTITSVKTVPATPSGFTPVGTPVQNPLGLPVYTYTFYKGDGEVSRSISSDNAGDLQRVVITHLTATSVSSQPTSDPLSGGVAIVTSRRDDSGHRVWEVTWAKGDGEIARRNADDKGGKLQRVVITHLTATSVTVQPTADPLSGGVAVVTGKDDEAGYRVWEVTWAKGDGEVTRQKRRQFRGKLLRWTLTHLTALAVGTQPTADPFPGGGGEINEESYDDQAGHRVWVVEWTKESTDLIVNTTSKRNKGKLILYRRERLGSAPAAPVATIGGTVVEIESGSREVDGYTVYFGEWAEGEGVIENSKQLRNQGKLVTYRQRALGTAPAAPAATIGGAVVLTRDDSRDDTGVTFYDRDWAEGYGVIAKRTQGRDGGLRLETWESLGAGYDASFMKPPGTLMAKDNDDLEGVTRWTVTCMQKSDGTAISDDGIALGMTIKHPFRYPGRAKAYNETLESGGVAYTFYDVYKSPPIDVLIDATLEIRYKTASAVGTLGFPLWAPTEWASILAKFKSYPDGWPRMVAESLPGYRAISNTPITFDGGLSTATLQTCLSERVAQAASGTPYSLKVAGGPANPESNSYIIERPEIEPAFIDFAGVQWYRRTIIYATIPAQPSLPV